MSQYQYYEFRAIDQPLTERQIREVRSLSTRAEITATSFTNEYHWGNFRGDPLKMMEKYYDAFLYYANWGTHWLMLRLPRGLVDVKAMEPYCADGGLSVRTTRTHAILDFHAECDGPDWDEVHASLSSLIPLRDDLLGGDLRSLYLAWLGALQMGELDDEEFEPPVPSGVRRLSGTLRAMADFLYLDPDLLAVAAAQDKGKPLPAPKRADLAKWIHDLTASEKEAMLLEVAQGKGSQAERKLREGFLGARAAKHGLKVAEDDTERRTVPQVRAAWESRSARHRPW